MSLKLTKSSFYAMTTRCTNIKSNHSYLGVVSICEEWSGSSGLSNFIRDMGLRPAGTTLDRIDGSLGYCKSNCKWSTSKEQNRNKRNNRFYEHGGKSLCIEDWSKELDISISKLYHRLNSGHTISEILKNPKRTRLITFKGKTLSVADWVRESGIPYNVLYGRIYKQLTLEKIFHGYNP